MNIHVARQPIFDKGMNVYGYELLYRQRETQNAFDGTQGDVASSRVIIDSFYGFGIDKLTSGKRAFINFTGNMLTKEIATLFPKDILTVEILETVSADPEIIQKCEQLKNAGYKIALDDFVFSEEYLPLIALADIIKIDLLTTPIAKTMDYLQRFRRDGLCFLAEKIELKEMFDLASVLGFDYFQGYFFSRPTVVTGSDIRPLETSHLRLIYETNRRMLNYKTIADIISSDVSLTYRLFRMVNSVAQGFIYPIKSIRHALVALGEDEIRKWVSLIAMMGLNHNQPDELLHLSLTRAKFTEQLGYLTRRNEYMTHLFLVGLFSLLETIMGRPFGEIFKEINIDAAIRQALVDHKGPYVSYYSLVLAHERGDWDNVEKLSKLLKISESDLTIAYIEALKWCGLIFQN